MEPNQETQSQESKVDEECKDEYVDSEESSVECDNELTTEEIEEKTKKAVGLKELGNDMFRADNYAEACTWYTKALKCCPPSSKSERSMIYNNRAAAKTKVGRSKSAVKDCTKAIDLNPKYVKALLRRGKLYEELEEFDRAIADYEELKVLDPKNPVVISALQELPRKRDEHHEKLKKEMLGKLKDLGNLVLRPFGLSTENFQVNQDPTTGSYSLNFKQ